MRYYKIVEDQEIVVIGKGHAGTEIGEEEYNSILNLIKNKPTADVGYDYKLMEDLTWELREVPVIDAEEKEISGQQLLSMIQEVL